MFSRNLINDDNQALTKSRQIVDFAISTYLASGIPRNVLNMAVLAIIDQYGLQVGGSQFPWSQSIYRFAQRHERTLGNSSITRYGDLVSPSQAA